MATESSSNGPREDHERFSLDRRQLVKSSAAIVGGILGFLGLRCQSMKPAPAPPACGPGDVVRLPPSSGAAILQNQLLRNPSFKLFYDHFTGQGLQFIPERVHAAVYTNGFRGSEAAVSPALVAVVPGFRAIKSTDTSHEAASIVAIQYGPLVGGAFAHQVEVGHNPYQIRSFSVGEETPNGIAWRKVERQEILYSTPEAIAKRLGPPQLNLDGAVPAPVMSDKALSDFAASVYSDLLMDSFERTSYPSAGVRSLLDDTNLVQKWSLVQATRYAEATARLKGGCCSSSTSCNACTSTSTSIIIKRNVDAAFAA